MSGQRYDLKVAAAAEKVLEQIRARGPIQNEVFTRLANLPVMLRVSGVPATLAFYGAKAAKGDDRLAKAYGDVGNALWSDLRNELHWPADVAQPYDKLSQCTGADLARAFRRLEALAGWLNRLAAALEREQRQKKPAGDSAAQPVDEDSASPNQHTGTSP